MAPGEDTGDFEWA
jgi:formylmethanofuran dehydrogenase subunit E-like metal-binding protein